jgi:hypothetical protein
MTDAEITRMAATVVYVAGPYRSPLGIWGVKQNIEAAARQAVGWLQMRVGTKSVKSSVEVTGSGEGA